MYGITLILALSIAGGAIAFIGDRLGSKIGKKKLSLFGLRPKYTSTLVTIIAGLLITLLTFAVLAAASENVRTALFGMEKLNRRISDAQGELKKAEGEANAAKETAAKMQSALAASQVEIDRLEGQQKNLAASNSELAEKSSRLEGESRALEAEKAKLTSENEAIAADNQRLSAEKSNLEKRTEALRQGLAAIRGGDIVFQAREVLATGTIGGGLGRDEVQRAMGAIIADADRNTQMRTGLDGDDGRIWLDGRDYDSAITKIAASSKATAVRLVAFANLVRGEPVRAEIELFEQRLIYRADEFVLGRRFALNGKTSRTDAENIARTFLHEVNEAAVKKGVMPDPRHGTVGVIEGAQLYELIDTIAKEQGTFAIVAYARDDTYTLGPLRLKLGLVKLGKNGKLGMKK